VNSRTPIDFYLERNPANMPKKTVQVVVDEMIATKTKAGRSGVHVKDMESRLGVFAKAMQMNIAQVTGQMIQDYLDSLSSLSSLKLSGRTQRNHLRHISGLFQYAVRKKYLTKDSLEELESIENPEEECADIEIFSQSEIRLMFEACRPEIVGCSQLPPLLVCERRSFNDWIGAKSIYRLDMSK
jgi:site-specific recombinase XerD